MVEQAGIVGKPNTGKSTIFAAATLADVKIAAHPFTTIEPNKGVGYTRIRCVCEEFDVRDDPQNSTCIDGWRFIPVELIDVAGLVPGAWQGRGLGNRFLDELRRASVLIHVVDGSGSTDLEGRLVKPGSHDPLEDVEFLKKEIDMWIYQIMTKEWKRILQVSKSTRKKIDRQLHETLSGLSISLESISEALKTQGLSTENPEHWSEEDLITLARGVRAESKPMIIAANKSDLHYSEENIERLRTTLQGEHPVIPTSAESELALRRAASKGIIRYLPGDKDLEITGEATKKQENALRYIRENVLEKWGSTGVQSVLNTAFFETLEMIAVFPVENENKLTDHHGHVLPDVFLVPKGTTTRDLAYLIHTDLGERFLGAIDVRDGKRLSADHKLEHRSIVKILTSR